MKCPICNIELNMSERQGIEIDYCPTCRGVWLDRGELDKIIERSKIAEGHQSNDYGHGFPDDKNREHKEQGYYGHKKKKYRSFLEDLFD